MAYHVFISHSAKDKVIADAICTKLEEQNIRCWIAPRDITPGREWGECILEGIQNCKILVVILTSNSNVSRHVIKEVERAVHKGTIIIPFRTENVSPTKSLEYLLSEIQWLDAITPPLSTHICQLAETIKAIQRNKPNISSVTSKPTQQEVEEFNELAPDDWTRKTPSGKVAKFFMSIFKDK